MPEHVVSRFQQNSPWFFFCFSLVIEDNDNSKTLALEDASFFGIGGGVVVRFLVLDWGLSGVRPTYVRSAVDLLRSVYCSTCWKSPQRVYSVQ